MKVVSWKGYERGDRGLTEVLYRHFSEETEGNFTNINETLNGTDDIRRTGISGVQMLEEIYTLYLQTDAWAALPVSYAMCTAVYIYGGKAAGGDRGGTVVKALCYKSEGRWFDSRWFHWNFSLT